MKKMKIQVRKVEKLVPLAVQVRKVEKLVPLAVHAS